MAATLTFVALCVAAIAFMLRFLVAICGRTGKAAHIGYAVQIKPGCDEGEGGVGTLQDEPIPQAPPVEYVDIPVWQQGPLAGNDPGGNSSATQRF